MSSSVFGPATGGVILPSLTLRAAERVVTLVRALQTDLPEATEFPERPPPGMEATDAALVQLFTTRVFFSFFLGGSLMLPVTDAVSLAEMYISLAYSMVVGLG